MLFRLNDDELISAGTGNYLVSASRMILVAVSI